jgi:hypothetical protein
VLPLKTVPHGKRYTPTCKNRFSAYSPLFPKQFYAIANIKTMAAGLETVPDAN